MNSIKAGKMVQVVSSMILDFFHFHSTDILPVCNPTNVCENSIYRGKHKAAHHRTVQSVLDL